MTVPRFAVRPLLRLGLVACSYGAWISGPAPAVAHEGQPIQVQLTEPEPGLFVVQWRVSTTIPYEAIPLVQMPEICRAEGERVVRHQPGGWLSRQTYRCSGGLAGRSLGLVYPLFNPAVAVLFRAEFLSGERLVHALAPTEDEWIVPQPASGSLALLRGAQSGVLEGARHVLGHWVHLLFVAVLVGFGARSSARWIGLFAIGQLVAVSTALALGLRPGETAAEVSVAIAVAFLASQALRGPGERRDLAGLAAAAGIFHGFGLVGLAAPASAGPASWVYVLAIVPGMDATLLLLAVGLNGLASLAARSRPDAWARGAAYGVGGVAVAVALTLAFRPGGAEESEARLASQLPESGPTLSAPSGSRRVAPESSGMPMESFLTVGPYEVRHEVLVRIDRIAPDIGLDTAAIKVLDVERQAELARRLGELVIEAAAVRIDGRTAAPILDRVDFMTVGPRGALPRPMPVPEPVEEALVGVAVAYVLPSMPNDLTMVWHGFSESIARVPVTASDPEFSRTLVLTADAPVLTWENELSVNPVASVTEMTVEPSRLPLPLVALTLIAAALAFAALGWRGWRRPMSLALARLTLALAFLAGPLAHVAVALPAGFDSVPSRSEARRILAGVLPNVYRAFELRDESAAYDRLAVSVTGETLTDVYLEHRRALEMEERGGARARVEAVEVLHVADVTAREEGGFRTDASWNVGGTVSHFGHRHFRQNRYRAWVELQPVGGTWKIRSIELQEEERVR